MTCFAVFARAHVLQEFDEVVVDRMLSQQLLQMLINVQVAVIRSDCHENHWREFESNILLLVRLKCVVT